MGRLGAGSLKFNIKPNQNADRATLTAMLDMLQRVATAVENGPVLSDDEPVTAEGHAGQGGNGHDGEE